MADSPTPGTGKPVKAKGGWRRFFTWLGVTVLAVLVATAMVIGVAYATVKLPDPNADFQTNTSFVYYNDGKEKIGSYQIQNRQSLPYKEIPQIVKDAIVAGENRTFWTDPGISIPGIVRALISVAQGDEVVGGSTITQQYIKVLYLNQDKTVTRKFTEILLAAKMGNEMSKEEILESYLNTVYFGRGAYGIEAASQAYFGKPAAELTDAEAIALTAIVNNPGNLDPAKGEKQAADLLERYQYTINGLVEMGKMTEAEKAEIYSELPEFPEVERDSQYGGPKGFLLNMVQEELKAKGFTEDQIAGGGLTIITTFDADAQEAAVESAQKVTLQTVNGSTKKARDLHAGLASVDVAYRWRVGPLRRPRLRQGQPELGNDSASDRLHVQAVRARCRAQPGVHAERHVQRVAVHSARRERAGSQRRGPQLRDGHPAAGDHPLDQHRLCRPRVEHGGRTGGDPAVRPGCRAAHRRPAGCRSAGSRWGSPR